MTKLVFLDTETTGLADFCEVWEIGLIARHPAPVDVDSPEGAVHVDVEYCWRIRPNLATAEPTGLRIGRYYERMGGFALHAPGSARRIAHPQLEADPGDKYTPAFTIAGELAQLLDGATIIGAVPDFDTRHLEPFLRSNGQAGTWHYHLVDVETFAAGRLALEPPWDFLRISGEVHH